MRLSRLLVLFLAVSSLAACGGKESVAPEEVEAQVRADMHAQIRHLVAEESRQDLAIRAFDESVVEYGRMMEAITERRKAMRSLNADYDATRRDFQELLDQHDRQLREQRGRVTAAIVRFEQATTPEEWDQLSKVATAAVKRFTAVIGSM